MKLIDKNVLSFTDFEIVMCNGSFKKAFKLICEKLDDAPIIEAEPKHGRWIWNNNDDEFFYSCSNCGHKAYGNNLEIIPGTYNYCPNCGARMDLDEVEE